MPKALFIFLTLFSLSARAAVDEESIQTTSTKHKSEYRRRYGMAGCGIGSIMVKDTSRDSQIGVWAINTVTTALSSAFDPTFAMSSGTSNCTDAPARGDDNDSEEAALRREQEVYITANLVDIEKDAARGGGASLDGLADVFGCESAASQNQFRQVSRSRYGQIFTFKTAEQIRSAYKQELLEQGPAVCTRLI